MRKIKIALCLHMPPPMHGASYMGQVLVNRIQADSGYDAEVIPVNTSVTLQKKQHWKAAWRFLVLLVQTIKILRSFSPDIIYFTPSSKGIAFLKDWIYVRIIGFHFGDRIFVHCHNKGFSMRKSWIWSLLYRSFFRRVKPILLSEKLYLDVASYVRKDECFFCANGLQEPIDESLTCVDRRYDFLFLSNLLNEKGIWDFLEAMVYLKDAGREFSACVVGADADVTVEDVSAFLIEKKLTEFVSVLGPVYGQQKEEIIGNCKTLVFPTFYHYECMPLVVIEAMRHGLAIVSTSEGALTDLVVDEVNGNIVPSKDPLTLFTRLDALIGSPQKMADYGRQSKAFYNRDYTERAFTSRMLNILGS